MIKRDLTGKRFGRLIVLERDVEKTSKSTNWKVYWKCKCDCGSIKSVRAEHLKERFDKHHTQSCGCLQKERASENGKLNALPPGEYSKRCLYHNYKTRSEKKNLKFELTRDQFDVLISGKCYYCGSYPKNKHKHCRIPNNGLEYNGIDRKLSSEGYVLSNVVSCCPTCNYAKNDLPIEEFVKWIEQLYNHLKSNKLL